MLSGRVRGSRLRSNSRGSNSVATLVGGSWSGVPELPETETIARDLDRALSGVMIVGVTVLKADVLREVSAASLSRRTLGSRIERGYRRAKAVVIPLDTGDRIVVQP